MKKITSILLTVVMLATLFTAVPVSAESDVWGSAEVATAFAGGTGTTADPYLISNAAELRYANDLINSGASYIDSSNATKYYYAAAYKLTADIDMDGGDWIPLGWYRPTHYDTSTSKAVYTPAFTGKFYGDKHVISNIKINWDQTRALSSYMGFFGYCNGATITNLGLNGIEIVWSNYDYVYDTTNNKTARVANSGAFAGYIRSTSISECYVLNSKVVNTNSGKNDSSIGGFVGALNYGNSISNSYVYNVEICAGQLAYQAGFAGYQNSSSNVMTNCYAAKIKCNQSINFATTYGFAFSNGISTNVTNCYSTMQDAQGDHISKADVARIYNPAYSLGETGVPVETLIEAMKDTWAYAQDDSINDGYPYLVTKRPAIIPATAYASGMGTSESPYLISTPEQLLLAVDKINSGEHNKSSFKLTADINVAGHEWTPIGTNTNKFMGSFDGDGHKIFGVTISGTPALTHMGLFGYIGNGEGTTVKNLGVENLNISFKHNTGNYMGAFAGAIGRYAVIENCYVKNSSVRYDTSYGSSGSFYMGSFAGAVTSNNDNETSYDNSPVIKNCYTYGVEIKSAYDRMLGGFVGRALTPYAAKFENCYVANVKFPADYKTTSYAAGIHSHLYGFINSGGKTMSAQNCYSEITGGEGHHPSTYQYYKAEYDTYATTGAKKADILTGFATNEKFDTNAEINDGYPHLWYETVPVKPDYVVKSIKVAPKTLTYTGEKGSYSGSLSGEREVTVSIEKNTDETEIPTVYIASYDMDGRLIKVGSADVNIADFSYTADIDCEKANSIKVFVWNENQKPVVEAYKAVPGKASTMNEEWPYVGDGAARKRNLITIGDSLTDSVWTGSSYSWPKSGWEKYIMDYVDTDEVAHVKHGHGGWTMKNFIDGKTSYHYCDWETIKTEFGMGDYVIVALGTNDESQIAKYNADPTTGYSAEQFKNWYKQIAADVKAKGAQLIVLTPPPSHDEIANGKFYNTHEWETTKALLALANEVDYVTVIDIGDAFANKLNELIDAGTYTVEDLIVQKNGSTVTGPGAVYVDSVHFSEYGADLLAKVIAEQIALRTTGLEEFITLPTK